MLLLCALAAKINNLVFHDEGIRARSDLLHQGMALEDVQKLAGYAEPRPTSLFERLQKQVTRSKVKRFRFNNDSAGALTYG